MVKHIEVNYSDTPELEYPKMQTLFKRGRKGKIIMDELSKVHFSIFKDWRIFEKIDGTNIRVVWRGVDQEVEFRGRHDNSQIPKRLYEYLEETFTVDKLNSAFVFETEDTWHYPKVILFGEGYGCFSWGTPILMADGSKIPIGKIVNKKIKENVLSYNFDTGKLESKKIIGVKYVRK